MGDNKAVKSFKSFDYMRYLSLMQSRCNLISPLATYHTPSLQSKETRSGSRNALHPNRENSVDKMSKANTSSTSERQSLVSPTIEISRCLTNYLAKHYADQKMYWHKANGTNRGVQKRTKLSTKNGSRKTWGTKNKKLSTLGGGGFTNRNVLRTTNGGFLKDLTRTTVGRVFIYAKRRKFIGMLRTKRETDMIIKDVKRSIIEKEVINANKSLTSDTYIYDAQIGIRGKTLKEVNSDKSRYSVKELRNLKERKTRSTDSAKLQSVQRNMLRVKERHGKLDTAMEY